MKSLSLTGIMLASLSIGCAKAFSWDDLEDGDLYIRDLDEFELDPRDLAGDFESELFERDFADEAEDHLHVRDIPQSNKRVLEDIAKTKKEMFAVYKDMSKKVEKARKKYPRVKDASRAVTTTKKKEADYDDVERDFLQNRAPIDLIVDANSYSVLRCEMLLKSFKPNSELVRFLEAAELNLKWDKWQYMEWDLLTLQAAQMKNLISQCNAAPIDGLSLRTAKVWMPFSRAVADIAGITRGAGGAKDNKMLQLAKDTVGKQGALAFH